jgi:hypothetical protein
MVVNMASLPSTITGLRSAARRRLLGASGACACGAVCVWTLDGACVVAGAAAGAGACAMPQSGKTVAPHHPSTTICFLSFLMPSCRKSFLDEQPLLPCWQRDSAQLASRRASLAFSPCHAILSIYKPLTHSVKEARVYSTKNSTAPPTCPALRCSSSRCNGSHSTCNFAGQLFRVEMRFGPPWDGLFHASTSLENDALRSWILPPGNVMPE